MSLRDVVDQLLNQHSLTDTGTTEKTNLSTTSVGGKEIDDLDTGLEDLSGRGLLDERRGVVVDGEDLVALDRTTLINGLTNDVHDTTERALADGNLDGSTGIDDLLSTNETLSTVHGNGTDRVLAKVSGDLEDETTAVEVLDLEGVENGGKVVSLELDIDDGTNDSLDLTDGSLCLCRVGADFTDEYGERAERRRGRNTRCKRERKTSRCQ